MRLELYKPDISFLEGDFIIGSSYETNPFLLLWICHEFWMRITFKCTFLDMTLALQLSCPVISWLKGEYYLGEYTNYSNNTWKLR